MYKICSNIKCFECQDMAAQSGEKCSDCNSQLVGIKREILNDLHALQLLKSQAQDTIDDVLKEEKKAKQEVLDQELAKPVEKIVEVEPSMKDQINNLDESVSFNKWRERKIK